MDTPCPYSPTLPPLAFGHLPLTGGVGPRSPITGVTPWVRQSISGAQNLSGWSKSLPAHWGLRRRGFRIPRFARLGKARSLHCSSSPTQTRCAGLCVGGRLRRPIWVENCGWCGSTAAPGFAEPTLPVRILAGGPRASPTKRLRPHQQVGKLLPHPAPSGPSSPRGRLLGDRKGRLYGVFCAGTVGSETAGAVVEPHRQQFLQTQGPVARRGFRPATPFLRAGDDVLLTSRASPVMGSGESGPMDLGEAERSRSPSAASPAAFW